MAGHVLVVLVRRVRRPVLGRREHLAHDEARGVERLRRAEVVHLTARRARTAQLDRRARGGDVAGRAHVGRGRRRHRDAAGARDRRGRRGGEVQHVGGAVEHRCPAGEDGLGRLAGLGARHGERARERHDDALDARLVEGELVALGEHADADAGVRPARRRVVDDALPAVARERAAAMEPAVVGHSRPSGSQRPVPRRSRDDRWSRSPSEARTAGTGRDRALSRSAGTRGRCRRAWPGRASGS